MTGLEPARRGHQNLNLARLPIPPHPLMLLTYAILSFRRFTVNTFGGYIFRYIYRISSVTADSHNHNQPIRKFSYSFRFYKKANPSIRRAILKEKRLSKVGCKTYLHPSSSSPPSKIQGIIINNPIYQATPLFTSNIRAGKIYIIPALLSSHFLFPTHYTLYLII